MSDRTGVGDGARVRRPADLAVHGAVDEREARRAVGFVGGRPMGVTVSLRGADEEAVIRLVVGHARRALRAVGVMEAPGQATVAAVELRQADLAGRRAVGGLAAISADADLVRRIL